jgi:hypothetical protein
MTLEPKAPYLSPFGCKPGRMVTVFEIRQRTGGDQTWNSEVRGDGAHERSRGAGPAPEERICTEPATVQYPFAAAGQ